MSNLTLFNGGSLPAHLSRLSTLDGVEDKDDFGGGGPALTALSIRGKEFRFRQGGQEQATGLRDLECIIIRRRERTSRRYFAGKYVSGSVEAPTCHSSDGVTPDRGENLQAKSCGECPHSQWGSKVSDNGNLGFACDSYKMLALVPLLGGQLAEQAVALNLPATSLKRSKGTVGNQMHAKEYFDALKKHNLPAIGAVTRLKFTSAEYPQIAFEFVRVATEAELEAALALRDSEEVVAAVEGALIETPAAIVEAEKPVVKLAELPKPEPRPVGRPKKEAVVVEAAPEPEPEVAQAAPTKQEASPDADVMAKVQALLAGLGKK